MGRDATKAAGNPWYQARKKAAEYDDRLCSRESAAEQLGMIGKFALKVGVDIPARNVGVFTGRCRVGEHKVHAG